jgi:uncharacterized protein
MAPTSGGVIVVPNARVRVGPVPLLLRFSLIKGRVGRLGINYRVETQEQSVAELSPRVFGHANDEINIDEKKLSSRENFPGD